MNAKPEWFFGYEYAVYSVAPVLANFSSFINQTVAWK